MFYVDGKLEHERDLELKPGITSTDFDFLFTEPGSHYVEVAIEGEDDLPADNRIVRSVNVVEKIPLLLVEGKDLRELRGFRRRHHGEGLGGSGTPRGGKPFSRYHRQPAGA